MCACVCAYTPVQAHSGQGSMLYRGPIAENRTDAWGFERRSMNLWSWEEKRMTGRAQTWQSLVVHGHDLGLNLRTVELNDDSSFIKSDLRYEKILLAAETCKLWRGRKGLVESSERPCYLSRNFSRRTLCYHCHFGIRWWWWTCTDIGIWELKSTGQAILCIRGHGRAMKIVYGFCLESWMIMMPFPDMSTRFERKDSDFDLGFVVSEVPRRFPSEDIE